MVAVGTLLVILALGLIITRVATVVLEATGMSKHAARFQARSAFTSSGFTTRESEAVVDHPVRRKVIMWLMLLGNAGIVAAAGTLIIGFRGRGSDAWRILELALGLLLLVLVSRSRWVDRRMTDAIGRIVGRYTDLPNRDVDSLIRLADGYAVSELAVEDEDWIAGRSLREAALRDEGVVVLGVLRRDGRDLGAPSPETRIVAGDTLIVYAEAHDVSDLDRRQRGELGDRQHQTAAQRHERTVVEGARGDVARAGG
ncbi:MAG: TrkA C-terminal domain-containing protein [Actinomycetes bacterium]